MDEFVFTGEEDHKGVEAELRKCPNCGNNLKFDPTTQKLKCDYCDSEVAFKQNSNYVEIDIRTALTTGATDWSGAARAFQCENCGAKVVLEKTATAKGCPFCGTAHVIPLDQQVGVRPNVVVPFALNKESATEKLKLWAKKKLFAPRKFKKTFTPENLNGVYMPCYTYDSQTFSTYNGKIGKRHTRTTGSGKNRKTETYIVWRYISGSFEKFFNDVFVSAGSKLSQKELSKLGNFSESNNRVYDDEYLFGYMAYGSEISVADGWDKAKDDIDDMLKKAILSQYNYDVVSYLNVSTNHSNVTYKYVLLPVYVGNYKYGKKVRNYVCNGINGSTTGKYPVSPIRVAIASLLGIALIVGLYLLL